MKGKFRNKHLRQNFEQKNSETEERKQKFCDKRKKSNEIINKE